MDYILDRLQLLSGHLLGDSENECCEMKLPFRYLFGPPLRRYSQATAKFCSNGVFMIGDAYVITISIIGFLVSIQDVRRMVSGRKCPKGSQPGRCACARSASHQSGPDISRDIKLISIAMMVPQYLWLAAGAASGNAVLFMPYLVVESLVIILEILDVVWSAYHGSVKRVSFSTTVLVFNWLQAFCAFRKWINACDL